MYLTIKVGTDGAASKEKAAVLARDIVEIAQHGQRMGEARDGELGHIRKFGDLVIGPKDRLRAGMRAEPRGPARAPSQIDDRFSPHRHWGVQEAFRKFCSCHEAGAAHGHRDPVAQSVVYSASTGVTSILIFCPCTASRTKTKANLA